MKLRNILALTPTLAMLGASSALAQEPITQIRVHNINNIRLPITNWGVFGNDYGNLRDPLTGLQAPGGEFPKGSNIEYLGLGALWIGATIPDESGNATRAVSIAGDASSNVTEFLPVHPMDGGLIQERSTRPGSRFYHPDAVSEQDFVTVYTDTITDPQIVTADDWSYRPHLPIGLKVRQESYAWSYEYARNFIILRYFITNLRAITLSDVHVGLYIDPQVAHVSTVQQSANDDQLGFREESDRILPKGRTIKLNTLWFADNDGDPHRGYNHTSPLGVGGVRLIGQPISRHWCWLSRWYSMRPPDRPSSFNWWASGRAGPAISSFFHDWGPQHNPGVANPMGTYGTPFGDKVKFHYLSNREFDYDQMENSIDRTQLYDPRVPEGWIKVGAPSDVWTNTVTRGFDSRALIAGGPYTIEPDETIEVAFAYVGGEGLHDDPDILRTLPNSPETYLSRLDFEEFDRSVAWAGWVYDNPGVDTDGDWCNGKSYTLNCRDTFYIVYFGENNEYAFPVGRTCDTVYIGGDGFVDLAGPPPPPSPDIAIESGPGTITVRWTGEFSETFQDPFSQRRDFEGYRVYWGTTDSKDGLSLLGSWDLDNYIRWELRANRGQFVWLPDHAPLTRDSLRVLYGPGFDPTVHADSHHVFTHKNRNHYFVPYADNRDNEYLEYGANVVNLLQRESTDSVWNAGQGRWNRFGRYRFDIDNLLVSVGFYITVTAIDHGFGENNLDPLESAIGDNIRFIYPAYSADQVADIRPPIAVYPNPYKATGEYRLDGFEDTDKTGFIERERRIHFRNLPAVATIRIYTLDGDLVREINHPDRFLSDTDSHCAWDLISRNTQAAVSGIYYWSVESEFGTETGKLVIIR